MNKENLILKWLDDNISNEEMHDLKQLPEFEDYLKISEKAIYFRAPDFRAQNVLRKVKTEHYRSRKSYMKYGIAASLLLLFSVLLVTNSNNTQSVNTVIAEQKEVILPDNSVVNLNADSRITYDVENWDNNRAVQLEGEAFFKVAKGSKFDVITNNGTISVLGTEFVVKDRNTSLEVMTYEGLVQVTTKDTIVKVSKGNSVAIVNGDFSSYAFAKAQPSWLNGSSSFKSVQLKYVLGELKRQYNITIAFSNKLPMNRLFTGNFPHNNLEQALQSISVPMNLKYTFLGEKAVSLASIEE